MQATINMISTSNEICLKPPSHIIKFTNEGIQTDEIWDVDQTKSDSDESLIDLSSSLDESEESFPISTFDQLILSTSDEPRLLPISLFDNDTSELCKAFCETYKEFFKDVYQKPVNCSDEEKQVSDGTASKGNLNNSKHLNFII